MTHEKTRALLEDAAEFYASLPDGQYDDVAYFAIKTVQKYPEAHVAFLKLVRATKPEELPLYLLKEHLGELRKS